MTTALDKVLKRAVNIEGRAYVVALSPGGMKLTLKGRQLGLELKWSDLVNGQAALATALQASVGRFPKSAPAPARPAKKKRPRKAG
jgi:hypothetical protein